MSYVQGAGDDDESTLRPAINYDQIVRDGCNKVSPYIPRKAIDDEALNARCTTL